MFGAVVRDLSKKASAALALPPKGALVKKHPKAPKTNLGGLIPSHKISYLILSIPSIR